MTKLLHVCLWKAGPSSWSPRGSSKCRQAAAASYKELSVKASGTSSRDVVRGKAGGLHLLKATLLAGRCGYPLCRQTACLAFKAQVCDCAGRGNAAVRKGLAKEPSCLVLKSWEVPWKRGERDCIRLKGARTMLSPVLAEEKRTWSASPRTEQGAGATTSPQGMAGRISIPSPGCNIPHGSCHSHQPWVCRLQGSSWRQQEGAREVQVLPSFVS